ncbi:uncharacterized protein LOC110859227 [Folsomia candida]|nr:uncharacterized protein LOC110859227 [Folsomia candida]XP_021963806.1 uncharacterized protein LOC110859227 [Folsomia candida]
MRRIPQFDGGYDQDDDYAEEEEEGSVSSSDYSSADRTESEDDEEEKNVRTGKRNSQRLRQYIEMSVHHEKEDTNNEQATRRKSPQQHTIKEKTKKSTNPQETFYTSQQLEVMAEKEKPKRKRGRPPKENKDTTLVPSKIHRGRGRPPTVKKGATGTTKSQEITKSPTIHQNLLLPPPAPNHHRHRHYDSNSSMSIATCLKCRKPFETGDALKNHAFWCDNSTRMTRSKRTGSTSSSSSLSVKRVSKPNKEPKSKNDKPDTGTSVVVTKHRGRPSKVNLDNVVSKAGLYEQGKQLPDLSNKPMIRTHIVDVEAKVSLVTTRVGHDLNGGSNLSVELKETETSIADDDDDPVVCPKCHARYRKLVSLQNHMPTCVGSESSEEEGEEPESDDDSCNAVLEQKFENNSAKVEETGETETPMERLSHPLRLVLPPAPVTLDGRENRPSPQIRYEHQSPCQDTNTFRIQNGIQQQKTGEPYESTPVLPPLPHQTIPLQDHVYPPLNLPQYDGTQQYQRVEQQQTQQQQHSSPQIQLQQHEMSTILQDTVTGQLFRVNIPIPFHQTHQPVTFTFPQHQLQGQQVNVQQSHGGHHPAPQPSAAAEVTASMSQIDLQQQLLHHSRNIDAMIQPPLTVVPSNSVASPHYPLQFQNSTQQLNSFQIKTTQQPQVMSPPLPSHQILHPSIPPHTSQSQGMDYHNPQHKGHRSHSSTIAGTFPFVQRERPCSQQNHNEYIPKQQPQISAQFQQHPLGQLHGSSNNTDEFVSVSAQPLFQSCSSSPSSSSVACLSGAVEPNIGVLSSSSPLYVAPRSLQYHDAEPRLPHPHLPQHQHPPQLSLNQQLQLAQQNAFHRTQVQQLYHNELVQKHLNLKSIGQPSSQSSPPSSPNVFLPSQQQPLQLSYQKNQQQQPSVPTHSNQLEQNGSILSPSVASELQYPSFRTTSPTFSTRQSSQITENHEKIAQPQLLNASQVQVHHHQTAALLHHQQQQVQQNAMLESLQRQIQLQTMGQCIGPQVSHHDLSASPQLNPPSQVTTMAFQLQQFPSGGIVLQPQLPHHHGMEKYRKVLPATSSHVPRPIEPKPAPQVVEEATTCSQSKLGSVKSQLANMILEKSQNQFLRKNQSEVHLSGFQDQHLKQIPPNLRKNPILTAVVRPMEHPLQKLSHQISQIESTFNSLSGGTVSTFASQSVDTLQGFLNPNNNTHHTATPTTTTFNNTPPCGTLGIQKEDTEGTLEPAARLHHSWDNGQGAVHRPRQKKKANTAALATSHSSPAKCATSPPKPIQLTLKRNERGGSYSVKHISETSKSEAKSKFKSLKITARITSGELEGTMTNVVVEPKIHIIPTPDPDGDELDSNLTIPEGGEGSSSVIPSIPVDFAVHEDTPKLAYRAVVVYEVSHGSTVIFRSSDVRTIWCQIFETAQGTRLKRNLPPLSYPATTVPLVHTFNMLGLTHRAVQFLLNHLPQPDKETPFKELPLRKEIQCDNESGFESGCARTEGYTGRKPFDMFGWLASKHRKPLEKMPSMGEEIWKPIGIPLIQRYRNLKERTEKTLVVMWSIIHGRGLYTRRDIDRGDIIIEYAGEVIRSPVCDQREKFYETKGIGCYMFRIDDEHIIDATMKGNAARFINHSCEPNCESKPLRMSGAERIVILALRKIFSGEELTYDYKFEKEENKIPCACGSRKCRKYLN